MRAVTYAVLLALLAPAGSPAQAPLGAGRRFTITTGLLHVDRRDDIASTVRYGGTGLLFELGYTVRGERWRFAGRAGGASANLTSALTAGDVPHEDNGRLWIEAELLRGRRWQVGALLAGQLTSWTHFYGGPSANAQSYSFGSGILAPAVGWERTRANSALAARVAVPLVALVHRAYSTDQVAGAAHEPPVFTTLPGVDLSASTRMVLGRRVDLSLAYRLQALRYDRLTRHRTSLHAFTAGLALGLGGGGS
jgi:hypothetical protein